MLPQKIGVKKTNIFDHEKIATEFNRFFANVGPMLTIQIPERKNTFESYLVKTSAKMPNTSVPINELRDAFFSFILNKSPGYDCKVINNNSWTLYKNVPWSKVSSFKLRVKLKTDEIFFYRFLRSSSSIFIQVQHKYFCSVKLKKVKFKSYGLN